MSEAFTLEMGKLYLMSGAPGAGKSTWLNQADIPRHMVVSSDEFRERFMGYRDVGEHRMHFQKASGPVFETMRTIVASRMAERLTTFVDATLINDKVRSDFADIARKLGAEVEGLIFDRPESVCHARNQARRARVPDAVGSSFISRLERESRFPYRVVPDDSHPVLVPRTLPHAQLDVVGDVHGLFDELKALLATLGYDLSSGVPVHPQGRKLLFLGDVVDRGQQSIETLQFIRKAVAAGHFMVAGNHERKLVQFWDSLKPGKPQARSQSSAETAMALMKLPVKQREPLVEFVRALPGYYTLESHGRKLVFAHATLTHFDPAHTLHSECLYGSEGLRESGETAPDARYAEAFAAGHVDYWLMRGHIPQTSEQDCVFSLERKQAYAGHLMAVRLDEFLVRCAEGARPAEALKQSEVLERSFFDYQDFMHGNSLKWNLDKLGRRKLVTTAVEPSSGLTLYKYSKQVFFDALWDADEDLLKARGIVFDLAGNIVVHPFDKVFNYGENNTGRDIEDSRAVLAVEKMNGFLGCLSKHPFRNEVLVTTTGSFDSPFVAYIKSFIDDRLQGQLLKFFSQHDVTLMFEVLHPEDPHIIEYRAQDHGLWLIGARGKARNSVLFREQSLDAIAAELGFHRAKWYETTFGELKAEVASSTLEGFMVRDVLTGQTLLKFKTPYYLVTKFLGRMGPTKVKHMFANPKQFKAHIDEEFYELVDRLVAEVDQEQFLALGDKDRVPLVRKFIELAR